MTDKDTFFRVKRTLNVGGQIVDLNKPRVMGILNITPDSFYSGSRQQTEKELLKNAEKMLIDGADFLDLGAYSSRPGANDISAEEEIERLIPAVKCIAKEFSQAFISVDTFRANVAQKAVENGAHIINDISGGTLDPNMFETVGKLNVPYILMHMKGNPQNMVRQNSYDNMMQELLFYFSERIHHLKEYGVKDIIIDPGFGFAKDIAQNYQLLKNLDYFSLLEYPILAGLSRKSMIWKSLDISANEALNGTSVLNTFALQAGACILRVHDVKEAKECITLFQLLNNL